MNKQAQLWNSLKDPEYRRLFAEDVGTGLAFQIKLTREDRGWTQEELGERAAKAQETISLLENPDYGRYTLATLKKLAAAFDVGLAVRFVPFSELVDWTANITPQRLVPKSFVEEQRQPTLHDLTATWRVVREATALRETTAAPEIEVYGEHFLPLPNDVAGAPSEQEPLAAEEVHDLAVA
jgi:transcriptional regulator with XRE-family HTH domain